MHVTGQVNSWERTSRTELIISTSWQEKNRFFLLTLDCAMAVCSTLEQPCLAYHRHKSQSFWIAPAGHILRNTCCDFEEVIEDKALWEWLACAPSGSAEKKHPFNLLYVCLSRGLEVLLMCRVSVSEWYLYMSSQSMGQSGKLYPVSPSLCSRT